jgi:hypothetical protein
MKLESTYSMKGLVDFANENYKHKRSGKKFTFSDVQQYIRVGNFPNYTGKAKIEKSNTVNGTKTYNIFKQGVNYGVKEIG